MAGVNSREISRGANDLWMFGLPADGAAEAAEMLAREGYAAVVLGDSSSAAALARGVGLWTYACLGTFTVDLARDGEDLLAVSARGSRHQWFGSGCPNARELRERHLDRVRELVASDRWDGVFLDGIRFASPHAGADAYFTCFCERCHEAAHRLGYDFERMRRDVGLIQDRAMGQGAHGNMLHAIGPAPADLLELLTQMPGILDWLRFRADCIVEHVAAVRQVVGAAPGKLLGAYLFTPALAPLVGQDYRRLGPLLDMVSPMIYRLGAGDAVLGSELAALATFMVNAGIPEAEATALVAIAAGLPFLQHATSPSEIAQGMAPAAIGIEVKRAAQRIGGTDKLMPILWLDDPELDGTIAESRQASGLCFFILRPETMGKAREAATVWRTVTSPAEPT